MLNKRLYFSLKRLYPRVEVIAEGERLKGKYRRRYREKGKRRGGGEEIVEVLEVLESGEEYKIDCPFCGDTRMRLTINHRWGLHDSRTGRLNLQNLMQCYNENCQQSYDCCMDLYNEVYKSTAGQQLAAVRGRGPRGEEQPKSRKLEPMDWPGDVIRLDKLAKKNPSHPALEYLEDRHFDPIALGRDHQFSYCRDSDFALARNRIVIPIFMKGMMVGWQCRYIGEWKKGDPPKYWTAPGMPRNMVAYGFDDAIKYPHPVIVEGPLDKHSFGPEAMALMGKTMGLWLRRYLSKKLPERTTVVVMLDPNQDPKEKKRGRPHHINKLACQLQELKLRVVRCRLPKDTDPGSLDRDYMIDCIYKSAKDQHLRVKFS